MRRSVGITLILALVCGASRVAYAAEASVNFGPYNSTFLEGGIGLSRPLSSDAPVLAAHAPWSITGWVSVARERSGTVVVAAIGDPEGKACRCLVLQDGHLMLALSEARPLHGR